MKYIVLVCCFVLLSCGFNNQKEELETLGKCEFNLHKIQSFTIAGTSVSSLIENKNFDFAKMPQFLLGFMNKDLPLDAVLDVEIKNPTAKNAAINQFDYIVLFEGVEIANGTVDKPINAAANKTTVVPVQVKGDVYDLITTNGDRFLNFLKGNADAKATVTFKIKPTIRIAGQPVKSPTYFSFDKQITKAMFLK